VARAEDVAGFFKKVHYAHTLLYQELAKNQGSGLVSPAPTRWASKVDCLKSVVENRVSIENTLGALRRQKYRSPLYDTLGWVWLPAVWEEFEGLLGPGQHLKAFVYLVEGEDVTLAEAVHHFIALRGTLAQFHAELPPRQFREMERILEARDAMFMHDWACACYLLDRGCFDLWWEVSLPPPPVAGPEKKTRHAKKPCLGAKTNTKNCRPQIVSFPAPRTKANKRNAKLSGPKKRYPSLVASNHGGDHRYRAENLTASRQREVMAFCREVAWPLVCPGEPVPPADEFAAYLARSGVYGQDVGACFPRAYWTLHRDSPLAPLPRPPLHPHIPLLGRPRPPFRCLQNYT